MDASTTNQKTATTGYGNDNTRSQQQLSSRAGRTPRGFQSSRPFQPQPQPLSLNTTSTKASTSMRSASSSISSNSSASSAASDPTFSPSLLSSSPTTTTALFSPLSPSSPTDSDPITHIHKAPDGSLLMNSNYASPASPVGEGFLDPRTMRRGPAVAATGGVVLGRRAPAAPRLHMDLQVSGGAELNMQVRGRVDMIIINAQAPHGGARRPRCEETR
ncbi:uncharacterized protein PG998_006010 [Apiospora kogelbergensis]|uniref:uncharacterized protein n=1 Tax=Apiospora kogelbergensis TaxID=1337665 RepID=UPI00312F6655